MYMYNSQYVQHWRVGVFATVQSFLNDSVHVLFPLYLIHSHSHAQCDASEATWQLIQVVLEDNGTQPDPRIMFLGGGCSPATEPLAALSGRFYNVTQVSYHLLFRCPPV